MSNINGPRGHQMPTKTDLDQVARAADAVKRPAYRWVPRPGRFEHLAGPEIPNINHLRGNLDQDVISRTEGAAA